MPKNSTEYQKPYDARRKKIRRGIIEEAKNRPCMDCGMSYPHYVMDFDHRDPTQKSFQVASRYTSPEQLVAEIDKCDVVCSNCHRKRTFKMYGSLV